MSIQSWSKNLSKPYDRVMTSLLPPSALPISTIEQALIDLARETIDVTTDAEHGEEGIHTMGAAVRAADGQMYAGVNLYHFTGGPCAELVALGAARAAGARELTHIVAVGNHGRGIKNPCGRDRQILADYYPQIRVVVMSPTGPISILGCELLPLVYDYHSEQH